LTRAERNARRRLAYHLGRARRRWIAQPMRWGFDDCALAQAQVQLAALGQDPCAAFRGRYRTRRGARRVLGHGGLPAALRVAARRYGWRKIRSRQARIGDIGLVPTPTGLGVVRLMHRGQWIGRNETGFTMIPTAVVHPRTKVRTVLVKAAWSVC
jgi:hypothetical protein